MRMTCPKCGAEVDDFSDTCYGCLSQSEDCTQTRLSDTDKMPFGKHKGTPMQDVPSSYLHWLWTNGKKDDHKCEVADYIRRNISALKKELPDAIWS